MDNQVGNIHVYVGGVRKRWEVLVRGSGKVRKRWEVLVRGSGKLWETWEGPVSTNGESRGN